MLRAVSVLYREVCLKFNLTSNSSMCLTVPPNYLRDLMCADCHVMQATICIKDCECFLIHTSCSLQVYPCPKDAVRHRAAVRAAGGKEQFPLLVDRNTARMLYESGAIVRYLYETYGGNTLRPPPMLLESTLLTGCAAAKGMTLPEVRRCKKLLWYLYNMASIGKGR